MSLKLYKGNKYFRKLTNYFFEKKHYGKLHKSMRGLCSYYKYNTCANPVDKHDKTVYYTDTKNSERFDCKTCLGYILIDYKFWKKYYNNTIR